MILHGPFTLEITNFVSILRFACPKSEYRKPTQNQAPTYCNFFES